MKISKLLAFAVTLFTATSLTTAQAEPLSDEEMQRVFGEYRYNINLAEALAPAFRENAFKRSVLELLSGAPSPIGLVVYQGSAGPAARLNVLNNPGNTTNCATDSFAVSRQGNAIEFVTSATCRLRINFAVLPDIDRRAHLNRFRLRLTDAQVNQIHSNVGTNRGITIEKENAVIEEYVGIDDDIVRNVQVELTDFRKIR